MVPPMSDPYASLNPSGYPEIHHHHHYHESPSADLVAEVAATREQVIQLKNLIGAIFPDIITSLNAVHFGQEQLEESMSLDLSALEAEVADNSSAVDSAITLLGSLAQQIRDAAGDPAAIQAIADGIDANTGRLAAAVAQGTPAEPGSDTNPDEAPHVDNTLPGDLPPDAPPA
jgi:hypothetical protein